jgi:hypothetical protein
MLAADTWRRRAVDSGIVICRDGLCEYVITLVNNHLFGSSETEDDIAVQLEDKPILLCSCKQKQPIGPGSIYP